MKITDLVYTKKEVVLVVRVSDKYSSFLSDRYMIELYFLVLLKLGIAI